MQIWFVFSLIFAIVIAAFAVLNSDTVTIRLFWENVQLSQSLVILISAVTGAAIAIFLGLFNKIKTSLKLRELSVKLKNSEKEVVRLSEALKVFELTKNLESKKAEAEAAEKSLESRRVENPAVGSEETEK